MSNKVDWRNPENYKYTEKLTPDLWAWQFLRRNLKYQAEWKKVNEKCMKNEIYSSIMEKGGHASPEEEMFLTSIIQASVPVILPRKWGLAFGYIDPEQDTPRSVSFMRRFGELIPDLRMERECKRILSEYIDRLQKTDTVIRDPDNFIQERVKRFRQKIVPEGSVAVTFDLSLPITPQIEYAQKILTECQNDEMRLGSIKVKIPRQHVDKWQRYLRILDARAEGAGIREIACNIFPEYDNEYPEHHGDRMVKDSINAAEQLVNKGYLKLLVRDPIEIL
jgi:hypothetical protein